MGNPSNIWTQLSLPLSPSGSIPYVDSDGITIVTKVDYLWFNPFSYQLSIGTKADQTGTDTLNIYYNSDAYWPYSILASPLGSNGTTAAHTVSTSRGTGAFPSISSSGDFIGKFSAWAYTSSVPQYMEMAGISSYVAGAQSSPNGAGGELRFFIKPDNVSLPIEYVKLTILGQFAPMAAGLTSLGAPAVGWSNFYLGYVNNAVAGNNVVCNAISGRVQMFAGNVIITVNNTFATATSVVMVVVESADATALWVKRVLVFNGSFQIQMNAACTTNVQMAFLVVNN